MNNVQDSVALITGAGSGINLAFAKILYEAGARVLIADLNLTQEAHDWVATIDPQRIQFQHTDVTRWDQLEAAFDAAENNFGEQVNIITPGAGVYEPAVTTFWKDNDQDSRYKVLDINLLHPIKTTRIAVRRLVAARKPGTIIYISSVGGQRASLITPLYTISKHGINALTLSMAPLDELVGIRVVAVAPGYVCQF
jgi:3-hydroxybutyrate dehydrogenase